MRLKQLIAGLGIIAAIAGCGELDDQSVNLEGERLARAHCSGCHLYPEPALLPKAIWKEAVLPRMGHRYGIFHDTFSLAGLYEDGEGGRRVRASKIYPDKPVLDQKTWDKIVGYYLRMAPDSLPTAKLVAPADGLRYFRTRLPQMRLAPPSATMVRFRPSGGGVLLGDANSKRLYWLNRELALEKAANLAEGIVDVQFDKRGMYLTMMGRFSPTDAAEGLVIYLPNESGRAQILLDNLQRPVHSTWADLNADGLPDAVVCEFGKLTGCLSYWQQQRDGTFSKTILRNLPGAIRSYIRDLNADGHADIIALFGQGDEGIFRYINDGEGHFREESVLRFPPVYGSSAFRLADVNQDGLEDIVYVCGDNADYRPIRKPYHGIRFFTNKGNGAYEETFFYPLDGAYDAVPADFDHDGDLDIATISFFPDFQQNPKAGFILLENQGNFTFQASTFPEVRDGRWMVMDVNDLEQDGDLDIILGPLTFEVVPDNGEVAHWIRTGLPLVVLENQISK